MDARSGPVAGGVAVSDGCLRAPDGFPDFDGTFWRSATALSPPLSDRLAYIECGQTESASPGVPAGLGTFTLVDHDHLVYRSPTGAIWSFVRGKQKAAVPCE